MVDRQRSTGTESGVQAGSPPHRADLRKHALNSKNTNRKLHPTYQLILRYPDRFRAAR